MIHDKFRTYDLAVRLYREVSRVRIPVHLQTQLLRASSSIVLNLAEGSGEDTAADRKRFYSIAMGSLREVQAILVLASVAPQVVALSDSLGAHLYKLHRAAKA